jgi:phosphatidylserine/phosphatidylglycerophosphate/cardiolipin synthase-like enzyme
MFVDWRGDHDERLTGTPDTEVGKVLADAARRGVGVRGLVWRSHWDRFMFSAEENRRLGEEINAAGGQCLLDMRVRTGGSHHQKFVVLRHHDRPELDIAFLGGIDLCHGRRDDASHRGDPQTQPMAAAYGPRPPWHDAQLAISGPAVGDVETVFRERWEDPRALSRSPGPGSRTGSGTTSRGSRRCRHSVSIPSRRDIFLCSCCAPYPRRVGGYEFAPRGERSVARGYTKAVNQARHLIYIEDQYLWSPSHVPDQDGRISKPPNLVGRDRDPSHSGPRKGAVLLAGEPRGGSGLCPRQGLRHRRPVGVDRI